MRDIESQDPARHLIGFEHRLKDRDRIKEKVYDDMDLLGRSPDEAISVLPDAIRYTFQYDEAHYTQGVLTDVIRIREQGFTLDKLKNSWSDDEYKGINSQWIEPATGQRFELQFHTRISFEAKQITHSSYERLRYAPGRYSSRRWCCMPSSVRLLPWYQFRPVLPIFPTTRRESKMPDKITYYAIIDDLSSRERPAGVLRRIYFETGGKRDEAFSRESRLGTYRAR